jgi:hypothetical protein
MRYRKREMREGGQTDRQTQTDTGEHKQRQTNKHTDRNIGRSLLRVPSHCGRAYFGRVLTKGLRR